MTTLPDPLVSILTPSLNQGRFLSDTIESVLRQDHAEVEHIIVDGGSTDETMEILRRYDGRIRFLTERDDGQAQALNKAFALSKGTIIGWLNSDDFYITRDVISAVLEVFRRQPAVDVVYGHAVWVNDVNRVLKVSRRPLFDVDRLRRFDFISQPAAFFRRHVVADSIVNPSLDYALDYALWLELASRDAHFALLSKPIAAMRRHPAAKSVAERGAMWSESDALLADQAQPPRKQLVSDLALMFRLKLVGLASFRRRTLGASQWTVPLSLPAPWLRPVYQFGLVGSRTTLLLPRELLARYRSKIEMRVAR